MTNWWSKGDRDKRRGRQGDRVPEAGPCPKCGGCIEYNGNYFCEFFGDGCDWALAHPAITKKDRDVCDRLGLRYGYE